LIRERVRAGLKRAVEAGKQLGRPKVSPAIEKRIQGLLRAKKGMLSVAKECGVGTGTVQRIAREMAGVSRPFEGVSAGA
jgi:DNA invertase Pin-like site-specific DNA recombinase